MRIRGNLCSAIKNKKSSIIKPKKWLSPLQCMQVKCSQPIENIKKISFTPVVPIVLSNLKVLAFHKMLLYHIHSLDIEGKTNPHFDIPKG